MNTTNLKSMLAAIAVALCLLAPAAQAESRTRDAGVGTVIAAQGNAALQEIRTELLIAHVLATRSHLPLRSLRSHPAASAAVARPHARTHKAGA